MPDELETMAYAAAGGVPWHGRGRSFNGIVTPNEMCVLAGADWNVAKVPAFVTIHGKQVPLGREALYREDTGLILDSVTPDWKPVQNIEAFTFFEELSEAGGLTMETGGVLQEGRFVWALARINQEFALFRGKDMVQTYLLFTNPHKYGWATSVSWTAIRVVCMNTLMLSLSTTSGDRIVRVNHRSDFVASEVQEILGISKNKMDRYQEAAKFLAGKKAAEEMVEAYFEKLFPVRSDNSVNRVKDTSKGVGQLKKFLTEQPGSNYGEGTWWQAYNAVTYYLDHSKGRNVDTRLTSAWYGPSRRLKIKALETALVMAA